MIRRIYSLGCSKLGILCIGLLAHPVLVGLIVLAVRIDWKIVGVIAAGFIILDIWWVLPGTCLRLAVHEWRHTGTNRRQTLGYVLDRWFFVVTMCQAGLMALTILLTANFVFEPKNLTGATVVAVATIAFFFIQAPHLGQPTIKVWFLHEAVDCGTVYDDVVVFAPSQSGQLLRFRLFNLSLNALERCTARFWFPPGFQVQPSAGDSCLGAVNKNGRLESEGLCAVFEPNRNRMDIASGDYIDFAVSVKPPSEHCHGCHVLVSFVSLSRLGEARLTLTMRVDDDAAGLSHDPPH